MIQGEQRTARWKLWGRWVALCLIVCEVALLIAIVLDWSARRAWQGPFFNLAFVQQFVVAVVALSGALWIYRHQLGMDKQSEEREQERKEREGRLADEKHARNLLESVRCDLARDCCLMQKLARGVTKEDRFERLRTLFLELACNRLLDLRRDFELARSMVDVLDLHASLNRSLESYCHVYDSAPPYPRPDLEALGTRIKESAEKHSDTTTELMQQIESELQTLA